MCTCTQKINKKPNIKNSFAQFNIISTFKKYWTYHAIAYINGKSGTRSAPWSNYVIHHKFIHSSDQPTNHLWIDVQHEFAANSAIHKLKFLDSSSQGLVRQMVLQIYKVHNMLYHMVLYLKSMGEFVGAHLNKQTKHNIQMKIFINLLQVYIQKNSHNK